MMGQDNTFTLSTVTLNGNSKFCLSPVGLVAWVKMFRSTFKIATDVKGGKRVVSENKLADVTSIHKSEPKRSNVKLRAALGTSTWKNNAFSLRPNAIELSIAKGCTVSKYQPPIQRHQPRSLSNGNFMRLEITACFRGKCDHQELVS